MENGEGLLIRPGEVSDTTGQLGELADRIRTVMDTEALNLTVEASARDEVSQRVAATLNEVNASFTKAANQGQQQLREISGTLRTHAGNVAAADLGVAV
jgi:phage-related protein